MAVKEASIPRLSGGFTVIFRCLPTAFFYLLHAVYLLLFFRFSLTFERETHVCFFFFFYAADTFSSLC
jgi:hypothetical protein